MTTLEACRQALPMLTWEQVTESAASGVLGDMHRVDAPFYVVVYEGAVVFGGYLNPLRNSAERTLDGDTLEERIAEVVALVVAAKDEAYTEADAWLELAKELE